MEKSPGRIQKDLREGTENASSQKESTELFLGKAGFLTHSERFRLHTAEIPPRQLAGLGMTREESIATKEAREYTQASSIFT